MTGVFSIGKKTVILETIAVVAFLCIVGSIATALLHVRNADMRDTDRLHDLDVLTAALDAYHTDYGFYPPIAADRMALSKGPMTCAHGSAGTAEWCELLALLSPYLKDRVQDPLSTDVYSYYYRAVGEKPRYYGLMAALESVSNTDLANHDGGQFCTTCTPGKQYRGYEVGAAPQYCADTKPDSNWLTGAPGELCGS